MSYTLSKDDINNLIDAMERPAKRTQLVITAIRELQHQLQDWQSRAGALGAQVDALQAENRKLRGAQGPTELDPRDARIAQLDTELKRVNKLLTDWRAGNNTPVAGAIRDDDDRRVREAYEAGRSGETGGHP